MNISIFGLGYVGCVIAANLSNMGHQVIGLDIDEEKVSRINSGRSNIIESDIEELIEKSHASGKLCATSDYIRAVAESEISFITVDTPKGDGGELNLDNVYEVAESIGKAIRHKEGHHIIAIVSTVLPGTNAFITKKIAEQSGKENATDFSVVTNPEFLREGTAVKDYLNPPYILMGTDSEYAINRMKELYKKIPAEVIVTEPKLAELMKYVNNSFHSLKISFANEVGNICKALDIDSHRLMDIFCRDDKLNISASYLNPGFAYGGSCLTKDTTAFEMMAKRLNIATPVISSITSSNEEQKKRALDIIESKNKKKIGILGLSFKSGSDDIRFSPIVDVIKELSKKNYELRLYDSTIRRSQLLGLNTDTVSQAFSPLKADCILDDLDEVVSKSEVIVIAKKAVEFEEIPNKYKDIIIVDLVRQFDSFIEGEYEGISWP